jgi:hypothetical protein
MSCEEFWTLSVHLLSVRPRTSPVDPCSDTLHWLYRISSVYHQLSAIIMLSFVSLQSSQMLHPLQIKGSKTKWKVTYYEGWSLLRGSNHFAMSVHMDSGMIRGWPLVEVSLWPLGGSVLIRRGGYSNTYQPQNVKLL